jgi:hypothetical protein
MNMNWQNLPPLPLRVEPLPWEDLGSFLARTARRMSYETIARLLQPETSSYQIKAGELPTLSRQADYDFLSHLLLLPEETLYQMTLHRFSPIINSRSSAQAERDHQDQRGYRWYLKTIDRQMLTPDHLRHFCLSSSTIRVCPACLASPCAYDRLFWRIKHLCTCPQHALLLQKQCPTCSAKLPSLRMSAKQCPSCLQSIHFHEYATNAQKHPEFSCLLQGDFLTLQVLGYEENKIAPGILPPPDDPRAPLPASQYFPLMHIICMSIAALDDDALFTFLSPPFYEFLTLLENTAHVTPKKNPQVQVAIAHWLFAGGQTRFFAFLDTFYYLLRNKHPYALFRSFPWSRLPPYSEAFRLLHQFYQQYRSTYEKQGIEALENRVEMRIALFNLPAPNPQDGATSWSLPVELPLQLQSISHHILTNITEKNQIMAKSTVTQFAESGDLRELHLQGPPLSPLPLRVQPLRWEDLHSFLSRTAKRMHYEKVTWLFQPEMGQPYSYIPPSEISLLTEQSTYAFFSRLLLIDEEALYQMTLHRFASVFQQLDFFPVLKSPWKTEQYIQKGNTPYRSPINRPRLEKGALRSFFLPNLTTQICPLCLEESAAYDRLYWKVRYLLTCHKHAIPLQRQCSACQKPIPSTRLCATTCPFCKSAYRSSSSHIQPLPKEASCLLRGDLLTLQALGVIQNPISPSFPYNDLRGALPVPQYFALLRAICISLHPLQVSDYRTFLPPALYDELSQRQMIRERDHVPPLQVAATHWIFEDWPTHFFAFLDALEHWSRETRKKHAFVWFPNRFLLGVKAPEATALLAGAYRQYETSSLSSDVRAREHRIQQRLAAFDTDTEAP